MSIHLFKHNQEAYNSVTAMLEREKMAAVIHPTGTGKSLIAFKLAEEHPSEKFLWLSPSEYIYQTQLENLGMEFDNIQFMSYEIHGDLNVPLSYCVNDVKLGRWISNIRSKRKHPGSNGMALSQDRIRQLDNIGMNWK